MSLDGLGPYPSGCGEQGSLTPRTSRALLAGVVVGDAERSEATETEADTAAASSL